LTDNDDIFKIDTAKNVKFYGELRSGST